MEITQFYFHDFLAKNSVKLTFLLIAVLIDFTKYYFSNESEFLFFLHCEEPISLSNRTRIIKIVKIGIRFLTFLQSCIILQNIHFFGNCTQNCHFFYEYQFSEFKLKRQF